MKRKNILWGFALLVVAMVCCYAFTSCGNDNDEPATPANPLLGAWEMVPDAAAMQQLEMQIVTTLQQAEMLTPEVIDALNRVKEIVASTSVVVQFNADSTARLYSYRGGIGPFITGSWALTEQALVLKVGTLELPVTDIQTDGNTLKCNVAGVPLTFKRYHKR